jgi:hypothetical protein
MKAINSKKLKKLFPTSTAARIETEFHGGIVFLNRGCPKDPLRKERGLGSFLRKVTFLTFFFPVISLAQLSQQWVYRYNGSGNWTEYITSNSLQVDVSGNLYAAFTGYHVNTGHDFVIMKFTANSSGYPVWVSTYPAGNSQHVNALTMDNAGNIYVTGVHYDNVSDWDVLTLKYSNSGQVLWVRTFNDPYNGPDNANCITLDNSGNVIVAGRTYNASTNGNDYLTVKYNSSGTLQWARTFDGTSTSNDDDEIFDITSDGSGNIYVTGKAGWSNYGYDITNIKYSPSGQGTATRYDGAEHDDDIGKKILVDLAGNYYVTGSAVESGQNSEIVTMKFSPGNVPLWVTVYDYDIDEPNDMKIDASGNIYVTGQSNGYITLKYNNYGTLLWASRLNSGIFATALTLDGYGNAYLTGEVSSNNGDFGSVKYSSNGVQAGNVMIYNGPLNYIDYGAAIAINSTGSAVYVAGWSAGSQNNFDVAIVKYSQPVGLTGSSSQIPEEFSLEQNYPNPFNHTTTIRYSLTVNSMVLVKVFNVLGKEVATLVNEEKSAGTHEIQWDAANYPSGTYFYRIAAGDFSDVKRMMLVR